MKKLWKMAVGTLVLSLALAGCSSKPASNSNSGNAAASEEPYNLTLVYRATPQKDTKMVQDAINKYVQPKINAKVTIQQIEMGQWTDKTNLMIASNERMDVFYTAYFSGYATNAAKGAFLPLNDDNLTVNGKKVGNLLQQYGQGITKALDPLFLEGSKVNGKNYGVPVNGQLGIQGGYVFRKDLAQQMGILDQVKNIKSNADLEAVLKVVKQKMPQITPLHVAGGIGILRSYSDWDLLGDRSIPGVILRTGKDTKVYNMFESPEYLQQLKIARQLMTEGLENKDAATTTVDVNTAMKSGNVFMIPAMLKPGKADELALAFNMEGKLDQVAVAQKTVSTQETTGGLQAISSSSKDPVKAMQFINLLYTDKALINMLNYGIEGVHYTKVSDNIIKTTDQTPNYNPGVPYELGDQFLNYVWTSEDPNKWETLKQFNQGVTQSPALGFNFDATPVSTEVAAIANVGKQYQAALESGSVDYEKVLPEFQDKLKAAGVDKVIAEKQKQLDAFLAARK
ncbi:ABC transporter substrate-binding protein [Paenibacillus thalictri]|uniref:DUF3502 domain-containing protein n=1 Tax=Paenibacillus thalictri TaxID=2527873 RepID=A0A4Q9DP19_9BACL|nr:ABC transporter substrate-binding protein [Paenibacillus thalictri]TBL76323.1 DUF3502 domain-containing protein [Paenibacillus thalictri]